MSALRRLRVCQAHRNERGSSLVEIMATIALLAMVLGTTFEGISSLSRVIAASDRRVTNIGEARTLMAVASKDLRTATRLVAGTSAFTLAADQEVVFYANLDNPTGGPKQVRIYVDNETRLISETTPPDAGSVAPNYTYNDGPASVRFVGKYVANGPTQPIFSFFDLNGTPLTNTPLNAADLLAVRQVRISLSIRKGTNLPVVATTLVNRVRLPNLDYQAQLGG